MVNMDPTATKKATGTDQKTLELKPPSHQSVPKLISKPLKEKIKYEAQELNFLRRTSRAKLVF